MPESSRFSPALERVLAAARPRAPLAADARPLGVEAVDRVLGGGLLAGRPHEIFAREPGDEASAQGFAAMLALRLPPPGDDAAPLLWLREEAVQRRAGLCGQGLAAIGLDPGRLILGILPDARALLRAAIDALRCAGLGAVILELGGNPALLDLTASRRMALAAEQSGVTPLLLRLRGAQPTPSAAQTRWAIGAAASAPLAAAAPGHPALAVRLLRQRGGPADLEWELEWNRDQVAFKPSAGAAGAARVEPDRPASLPGARLPLSGGRPRPAASAQPWRLAG